MYAEPPRKGVSFSPTITRTGTSIAGNDSMTEPSCCLRMRLGRPRPSLRFGAGLLVGEPPHLLVDEPVPAGTGRVVAVAGTGVEQDQALDAVRVGDAKRKREVAAERMTADDRTIGADVVEQCGHVPEHARDGVRLGVGAPASVRPWPRRSQVTRRQPAFTIAAALPAKAAPLDEKPCVRRTTGPSPRRS